MLCEKKRKQANVTGSVFILYLEKNGLNCLSKAMVVSETKSSDPLGGECGIFDWWHPFYITISIGASVCLCTHPSYLNTYVSRALSWNVTLIYKETYEITNKVFKNNLVFTVHGIPK